MHSSDLSCDDVISRPATVDQLDADLLVREPEHVVKVSHLVQAVPGDATNAKQQGPGLFRTEQDLTGPRLNSSDQFLKHLTTTMTPTLTLLNFVQ